MLSYHLFLQKVNAQVKRYAVKTTRKDNSCPSFFCLLPTSVPRPSSLTGTFPVPNSSTSQHRTSSAASRLSTAPRPTSSTAEAPIDRGRRRRSWPISVSSRSTSSRAGRLPGCRAVVLWPPAELRSQKSGNCSQVVATSATLRHLCRPRGPGRRTSSASGRSERAEPSGS